MPIKSHSMTRESHGNTVFDEMFISSMRSDVTEKGSLTCLIIPSFIVFDRVYILFAVSPFNWYCSAAALVFTPYSSQNESMIHVSSGAIKK